MSAKRSPKIVVPRLIALRLMSLIEGEYAARGEGDEAFAKYAGEKLGFPAMNDRHVQSLRTELGIPATRKAKEVPKRIPLLERTAVLEAAVLTLNVRVEALESEWYRAGSKLPGTPR